MKILALSYYFPPIVKGGAEISFYYLLKYLKEKFHVDILLIVGREVKNIDNEFKVYQPSTFLFPSKIHFISEFFWPKIVAKQIIRHINVSKFDIVVSNDLYSLLVCGNLKKILESKRDKIPKFIFIVRDYLPICVYGDIMLNNSEICTQCNIINLFTKCYSYNKKSFFYKPAGLFLPELVHYRIRFLLKMDGLIFISSSLMQQYETVIMPDKKKQTAITNIVDIILEKEDKDKEKDKEKILYVGRMEDHKGVPLIINVLPMLYKIFPNLCFYFVGDGKDKQKYKREMKKFLEIGYVRFYNWIPHNEIKKFYQKAGILLVPSRWPEPLGRTLLEGMLHRCIVIASNHGFFKEIIKEGVNGFLFEKNNYFSLFEKIKYVIENFDRLENVRENALRTVIEKFDPEKITNKYIEFFNEMIK